MTLKASLYVTVAAIGIASFLSAAPLRAQTAVAIDNDDIGGVVTGTNGPEAGGWVIAETTDLPTKFAKMAVTDDQGRYVVPDLPKAKYQVWVRGYGLVDSPKVDGEPGQQLNLRAVPAPNEAAAAHYYPAIYWFAMLQIPPASEFGGSTDIPKNITRENWLRQMNNVDCIGCHQLGQESTRTIPAALGEFKSGQEAWQRRVQSGQTGEAMTNRLAGQFGGVPFKYFGEWTALGMGRPEDLSARPDLIGSAQSDRQRLWAALRLAGILDRHHADPRSEDEQGDVFQDAGSGSEHGGVARASLPCERHAQATRAVGVLGRREDLGHARQQP